MLRFYAQVAATHTRGASTIMHCIPVYKSRLWSISSRFIALFRSLPCSLFFGLCSVEHIELEQITWMTSGEPVVDVIMWVCVCTFKPLLSKTQTFMTLQYSTRLVWNSLLLTNLKLGTAPHSIHLMFTWRDKWSHVVCCWSNTCYWRYSNKMVLDKNYRNPISSAGLDLPL